jgi:hypothetical protein
VLCKFKSAIIAKCVFSFSSKKTSVNMNNIEPFHQAYTYDTGNNLTTLSHPLGDFLNPALVLLGQGLKKSPIGQKLDFANHPYLCKSLY